MKHTKKFREIAPEMAEAKHVQFNIHPELLDLIIALARNRGLVTSGANQKAVSTNMRNHLGEGMVAPEVIKLAATLALLCQTLADGKSKKAIHEYLNYRISVAGFFTGATGRDLLGVVATMVRNDLNGFPNRKLPRQ